MKKLVHLGRCQKVHGIKGGFVFNLLNNESSILTKGFELYINKETEKPYKISSINFANKVICYLEGVDNRNQSETLIPFDIYADRDVFPELSDGEFYLSDLIGFKVINDQGKQVGFVNSFYNHGAGEIVVIKLKNDDDLELPFVEAFFPEIRKEKNEVLMINPEIM